MGMIELVRNIDVRSVVTKQLHADPGIELHRIRLHVVNTDLMLGRLRWVSAIVVQPLA